MKFIQFKFSLHGIITANEHKENRHFEIEKYNIDNTI